MAKKRRVSSRATTPDDVAKAETREPVRLDPSSLALGLLGGLVVYVTYYPSDSVAVEKGDALWFGFIALVIATIALASRAASSGVRFRPCWVDGIAWLLGLWMMLAAFGSSPPGNLRMATNEAWLWISAAAVFTASRYLLDRIAARRALLLLMLVCGCGLAFHAMHQYYISLPESRAQYQRDPDAVLRAAGFDAPEGSSERMVFENRLLDGGPTATFALANSMAAVLLVGCVLALGVLRLRWGAISNWQRVVWSFAFLVCFASLLAARSRSATLAMMLAVVLIFLAGSRLRNTKPKQLVIGLAMILAVGCIGLFGLAAFGNPEWFEEAIPSLSVRFQYWRSTIEMVLDRPLFGAGPGNFQSIYERYREASATEQVAEPHNFLFETMASGGLLGLGMLLALIVMGARIPILRMQRDDVSEPPSIGAPADRWLWLGAGLGLLMVWLIGFATRMIPDLDANLFAIPFAIAVAVVLWPTIRTLGSRDIDLISAVMLAALTVHLLVAGGWTVPGVAIIGWLLAGLLTRDASASDSPESDSSGADAPLSDAHIKTTTLRRSGLQALLIIGCGGILLLALHWMSIRPVDTRSRSLELARYWQSTGQRGRTRSALDDALAADAWSPDAAIWISDFYRWKLVYGDDLPATRKDWESMLAEAKRRAGDDPAVYRMVGVQQLHLYQRHGLQRDLEAANETFSKASQWSPASEWLTAQMAEICRERGEVVRASELAARAEELSNLGGNIERSLDRQQLFLAKKVGPPSEKGPRRAPASELLANHLPSTAVNPEN